MTIRTGTPAAPDPCGRSPERGRSIPGGGFGLVEVLIVVLVLGIAAMVVLPQFESILTETKLNEATGEVLSGLEYARGLATLHQRPFGLSVDVDDNAFRVFDSRYRQDPLAHHDADPPCDAYGTVLNATDKKWYVRNLDTLAPYQGVRISSGPAGGRITFYPDGHCGYSDCTIVTALAGQERTVTVNGTTGEVTVQ